MKNDEKQSAHKITNRASYLLSIFIVMGNTTEFVVCRVASIVDIRVTDLCRREEARMF